jgi:predicted RNase H-like HicB family nuclease
MSAAKATEMSRYLIVIEETPTGFSAYSPDVAGCVATGATRPEVERNMHDALEFHLDGLREDGQPVPPPSTSAAYVEVAA